MGPTAAFKVLMPKFGFGTREPIFYFGREVVRALHRLGRPPQIAKD